LSSSEFTDQEVSTPFEPNDTPDAAEAPGEQPPELTAAPLQREGLPRGFRMRHDAHFVDQLDAAPPGGVLRMLPLGGLDAPACGEGAQIEALATSIRRVGLVEPLVVRRRAGRYEVIAGAKRLSAARLAQLDQVPCIVRDDLEEDAMQAWNAPPSGAARIDERAHGPFSPTPRERALDEAIGSLNAARNSIELTVPRSQDLRSRTALDLLRAEIVSTRLALTAMRVLSAMPLVRRTPATPKTLLDTTLSNLAPVVRLLGARVSVTAGADLPPMTVMQPLASFALEACLATVLTLAGDSNEPNVTITVENGEPDASALRFGMRLERGWLPVETARRLTDVDWGHHPGGVTTAMLMSAADSVARAHGGGVDVATDYDGFSITVTLSCS
jgi:ParB-like chromosome segregation protein Spo0J